MTVKTHFNTHQPAHSSDCIWVSRSFPFTSILLFYSTLFLIPCLSHGHDRPRGAEAQVQISSYWRLPDRAFAVVSGGRAEGERQREAERASHHECPHEVIVADWYWDSWEAADTVGYQKTYRSSPFPFVFSLRWRPK